MRSLLLVLTVLFLGMSNAPSLAEDQKVAAESAAGSGNEATDQVGDQDSGAGSDTAPSTGSDGGTEESVEYAEGHTEPNPQAAEWPKQQPIPVVTERRAYDLTSATTPLQAVGDCDCCGDDCQCPNEMVCKAGDCKKNYLLFFTAKWCGPCKSMYPVIDRLREAGYIVYVLDVNDFKEAAAKFRPNLLPTFIVMDGGKEVDRLVGVTSEARLRAKLKTREEQPDEEAKPETNTNPYQLIE